MALLLLCAWLGAWVIEYPRIRVGPVALLIRWLVVVRAATFLAREMAGAAWKRRERWEECLSRARRES